MGRKILNSNLRVCFFPKYLSNQNGNKIFKDTFQQKISFDVRTVRVPVRENLPGYLWQVSYWKVLTIFSWKNDIENSAFPILISLLNASLSLKKESSLEIYLRSFIS